MSPTSSIAVTGMSAAWQRMGAAAHNVANLQTPGHVRQIVHQQTQGTGGVSTWTGQAPRGAGDLSSDLVQLMVAAYSFKANLRVIQVEDRTLGSLLNVRV